MKQKQQSPDWRKSVYRPSDWNLSPEDWRRLEQAVIARDRRCQACKVRAGLSVHHIIPRRYGGKDDPGNLIVLCYNCHNEVEGIGADTFQSFYDWLDARVEENADVVILDPAPDSTWQKWVYGGYRSPAL